MEVNGACCGGHFSRGGGGGGAVNSHVFGKFATERDVKCQGVARGGDKGGC